MSLDTAYDPDNIFAKIIRGEIPAAKLHEDNHVLAFMDAFPQSEGHALVISKTAQATNLLDVPEDTLCRIAGATQRIARAIRAALDPDGIRIMQFNGAPAGQSVYHLHFHVIPVWEGRPLGSHGSGQADPSELERLAGKIREQL
jgi:histidine triad (HIT) family protein